MGIAPADNPHSNGQGGEVNPKPTTRERRLLALAKQWKAKAQEVERKESELRIHS